MTIIAWDGAVLACDSLNAYVVPMTVAMLESKIQVIHRKAVSGAGPEPDVLAFFDWVEKGMVPEDYPKLTEEFEGVILMPDADYPWAFASDSSHSDMVRSRFSLGHESAVHYCNGLMDLGLTAVEAVEMACNYSLYCRGPVYSIDQCLLQSFDEDEVFLWQGEVKGQRRKRLPARVLNRT